MSERFDSELPPELAGIARELESLASASDRVRPSPQFADRVAASLAQEPAPAPARAVGSAVRHARFGSLPAAIVDAWRVVLGSGRPIAVRSQALAVVALTLFVVVGLGGLAAVGADRLFGLIPPSTPAVLSPNPVTTLSIPPSQEPSLSSSPTGTSPANPSPTSPSDSTQPARAGETPGLTAPPTRRPTATPRPTPSPTPTETAQPSATLHEGETPRPSGTEDGGGGGGSGGGGSGSAGSGSGSGSGSESR